MREMARVRFPRAGVAFEIIGSFVVKFPRAGALLGRPGAPVWVRLPTVGAAPIEKA